MAKVMYARAQFITHKIKKDPQGAIEQYEELQKRYPDSSAALNAYRKIGRALNDMGKADAAIASLDKMVAKDASKAASYGWFCFRQRCHPERGLEVVKKALEEGVDNPSDEAELYYLIGELSHLTGDDAAALAAMKKAADTEPKSAFYKRMVRRFERAG